MILILILIAFIFLLIFLFSLLEQKKLIVSLSKNPPYQVEGPLVSIIIPAYNEEDYLPNCLRSIKNQTYKNIEIIVVDNNSQDKTPEIAKNFGAKVVKVEKKNLSVVRNAGAKVAKGEILFFVDADSILYFNCVEKLVKQLSGKTVFSHGGIICYDSKFHNFLWVLFNRWIKPNFYTSGRNGVCIFKKAFWEIGGYNEKLDPLKGDREDLDLGMRIIKKFGLFSVRYCPSILIGTSARREIIFGYPIWQFPAAWRKGARGVRRKNILY